LCGGLRRTFCLIGDAADVKRWRDGRRPAASRNVTVGTLRTAHASRFHGLRANPSYPRRAWRGAIAQARRQAARTGSGDGGSHGAKGRNQGVEMRIRTNQPVALLVLSIVVAALAAAPAHA